MNILILGLILAKLVQNNPLNGATNEEAREKFSLLDLRNEMTKNKAETDEIYVKITKEKGELKRRMDRVTTKYIYMNHMKDHFKENKMPILGEKSLPEIEKDYGYNEGYFHELDRDLDEATEIVIKMREVLKKIDYYLHLYINPVIDSVLKNIKDNEVNLSKEETEGLIQSKLSNKTYGFEDMMEMNQIYSNFREVLYKKIKGQGLDLFRRLRTFNNDLEGFLRRMNDFLLINKANVSKDKLYSMNEIIFKKIQEKKKRDLEMQEMRRIEMFKNRDRKRLGLTTDNPVGSTSDKKNKTIGPMYPIAGKPVDLELLNESIEDEESPISDTENGLEENGDPVVEDPVNLDLLREIIDEEEGTKSTEENSVEEVKDPKEEPVDKSAKPAFETDQVTQSKKENKPEESTNSEDKPSDNLPKVGTETHQARELKKEDTQQEPESPTVVESDDSNSDKNGTETEKVGESNQEVKADVPERPETDTTPDSNLDDESNKDKQPKQSNEGVQIEEVESSEDGQTDNLPKESTENDKGSNSEQEYTVEEPEDPVEDRTVAVYPHNQGNKSKRKLLSDQENKDAKVEDPINDRTVAIYSNNANRGKESQSSKKFNVEDCYLATDCSDDNKKLDGESGSEDNLRKDGFKTSSLFLLALSVLLFY